MYHIVVVSPNKEETPLLHRVRESLVIKRAAVIFDFCDAPEELSTLLQEIKPDYICLSTSYSPQEQLDRVTALASHIRKSKRLLPLIYAVDWKHPLPSLLGTSWSGQVGVLHTYSSSAEIIDLFQRLDGFGVTVGL